jgi:hypothetical protein
MHALLHRAAHLFAFVFFAWLKLAAYFLALEVFSLCLLLRAHQLQLQVLRVVDLVARHKPPVLATGACLLHQHFAPLAIIVVAFLGALVSAAGEEALADALAHWDTVRAFFALLAEEGKELFPTTGAETHSLRGLLAGRAGTIVTHFLTGMLAAVQFLPADLVADKLLASTLDCALFLTAIAAHLHIDIAAGTLSLMALLLAIMLEAVE